MKCAESEHRLPVLAWTFIEGPPTTRRHGYWAVSGMETSMS